MKSAYELAMERLNQESGPAKKLSDAQKARIAEIEKVYDAKIAAVRLGADEHLAMATTMEEYTNLKTEMALEVQRLEEQRDAEKGSIWEDA